MQSIDAEDNIAWGIVAGSKSRLDVGVGTYRANRPGAGIHDQELVGSLPISASDRIIKAGRYSRWDRYRHSKTPLFRLILDSSVLMSTTTTNQILS